MPLCTFRLQANSRTELRRSHDISWNLEAQLDVLKAYTFIIEVLLQEPLPIPSINLFQHHSSPSHSAIKAHIPAISTTPNPTLNQPNFAAYLKWYTHLTDVRIPNARSRSAHRCLAFGRAKRLLDAHKAPARCAPSLLISSRAEDHGFLGYGESTLI